MDSLITVEAANEMLRNLVMQQAGVFNAPSRRLKG